LQAWQRRKGCTCSDIEYETIRITRTTGAIAHPNIEYPTIRTMRRITPISLLQGDAKRCLQGSLLLNSIEAMVRRNAVKHAGKRHRSGMPGT
jgi:hypothetical protein